MSTERFDPRAVEEDNGAMTGRTRVASRVCEVKTGLFGACRTIGVAVCQYCGRAFCAAHGVRLEDGQEICARKRCQEKRSDLVRHLAYKEEVARRNLGGFCGVDGCQSRYGGQCSKCRGLFCLHHLHERQEIVRKGYTTFARPASMCDHCWRRRPLWSRT